MNHDQLREWVQMEFDGELENGRKADLEAHLAVCPECSAERASLARLGQTLAQARVEVRPDFRSAVLAALPPAGWEARSPRSWAWPAALVVAFAAAAAALLGSSGSGSLVQGPVVGAIAALFDLVATTAQTGAGLLTASWRGVGFAVQDLFGGSVLRMGIFGFGVLCLNLLFFRLLRRPSAAKADVRRR
jgi:anti-sigma factor RsiW